MTPERRLPRRKAGGNRFDFARLLFVVVDSSTMIRARIRSWTIKCFVFAAAHFTSATKR